MLNLPRRFFLLSFFVAGPTTVAAGCDADDGVLETEGDSGATPNTQGSTDSPTSGQSSASTGDDGGGQTTGDDGASSGDGVPADPCTEAGHEPAECMDAQCQPVWGTPYVDTNPDAPWCLFGNGLEYLGCVSPGACQQEVTGTLCDDQTTYQTMDMTCELAGYTECEPPADDAPPC